MKKTFTNLKIWLEEFSLFEFLTSMPELEFLGKIISSWIKKNFPRVHKKLYKIVNFLCESEEPTAFNLFTGTFFVLAMGYWAARLMIIIFSAWFFLLFIFFFLFFMIPAYFL